MEQALTAVCKDIRLGKILIQTNHDTGEPELHYLRLPKEISEDYVILMDSTVSTGAAAMMAVRVLLDHDVQEDRIFLLSLLMSPPVLHSLSLGFPPRFITKSVPAKQHMRAWPGPCWGRHRTHAPRSGGRGGRSGLGAGASPGRGPGAGAALSGPRRRG
uniref:Phosphoribosyltransferase domain-containing protein n=1 Tax=Anas platyrhynchos platyrhynchos TaxID=8840 RepID=A0A493TFZ3_ANAPP